MILLNWSTSHDHVPYCGKRRISVGVEMYHLSGDWHWVCGEGPRGSRIRNKWLCICDDRESHLLILFLGFPGGSTGKESTCNVGDLGSTPGLGRSPGERNSNPLQYSSLENSMDYTVHRVTKIQTQLRNFHFHFLETQTSLAHRYEYFSHLLSNPFIGPFSSPVLLMQESTELDSGLLLLYF